jgi:hypothetical protein
MICRLTKNATLNWLCIVCSVAAVLQSTVAFGQTRMIETTAAFVYHVTGVMPYFHIPDTWASSLDGAYAAVLQAKAELDAQPGCPAQPNIADIIYRIAANLRANPNADVINGIPQQYLYDRYQYRCFDGYTTYYTGTITLYARCPNSGSAISWSSRFTTTGTPHTYIQWCQGTSAVTEPQFSPPTAAVCPKELDTKRALPAAYTAAVSKPVGNPIYPTTGLKVETDVDYRSADGALEFVRHYDSARGAFASLLTTRIIDRSTATPPAGCYPDYLLTTYGDVVSSYCFPYTNSQSTTSYQVFTSTGRQLAFSGAPGSIFGRPGVFYWLERLTDGQGVVSWRLEHDNMVELYDANGILTSRQWADGRRMSVVYSDASTPATIAPGPGFQIKHVDGYGRELNFQYDAVGNLQKLIDPAGRETVYSYEPFSANGCAQGSCFRLASVQYPDGTTKQYFYNEPAYIAGGLTAKLTGITDERGVRIGTYAYDASARAISTQGAGGVSRFSITQTNSTTTDVTDPLGAVRTYTYKTQNETKLVTAQSQPPGAGCLASNQQLVYSTRNLLTEAKDFNGNRTCYRYDSRDLETLRAEGITGTGTCTSYLDSTSPPAGMRIIATQWTATWRFKSRIAEPLKITSYGYHGQVDP